MSEPTGGPDPSATTLPERDDFPERGSNALGSFGQRAVARVLDEAIISVPFALLLYHVVGDEGTTSRYTGAALVVLVVAIAVQASYEIGCVGLWGRTLGKWLLGLRVARYTDGGPPTWPQAALRAMLPLTADAAVTVIAVDVWGGAVVYLSSFFNPLRRGWHDAAGGTLVVRTR